MRPPLRVLAVAACLLLAGCVSPTARPTPERTPTEEPSLANTDIEVRGGTLPIDAERVFVRTTRLLGAAADDPTVRVRDEVDEDERRPDPPGGLRQVLGIGEPRPSDVAGADVVGGATNTFGTVYIVPTRNATPGAIERTLAHEFVHVVQFEHDVFERMEAETPDAYARTTDNVLAQRSLLEGGAVFGADAYVRRYLGGTPTESSQLEMFYPEASAGTRYFWGPYLFGAEYVGGRIDSPGDLLSLYDDPPVTTEQVLHDQTPAEEPAKQLLVEPVVRAPGWDHADTDTKGELFLRVVLSKHVSLERARVAAAGWGRDRAVRFVDDEADAEGYAWVFRWDTTADADEFVAAARRYLDGEANRRGDRWTDDTAAFRLSTVSERTVVLFAGDESFVDRAAARGTTDDVTLVVRDRPRQTEEAGDGPTTGRATDDQPTTEAAVASGPMATT